MAGLDILSEAVPEKYSLICQSPNTIKSALVKTGNLTNNNKGVAYSIPCGAFNKEYIGETGNTLEKRIKDHKYAFLTENNSNAIYKHYTDTGHEMNFNKGVGIVKEPNYRTRRVIEAAFIQSTNNINIQTMCSISNYVYNNLAYKILSRGDV